MLGSPRRFSSLPPDWTLPRQEVWKERGSGHRAVAWASIVLLLLTSGAGLAGWEVKGTVDRLQAKLTADFRVAQGDLEAGKKLVETANSQHNLDYLVRAQKSFDAARSRFRAATQTLAQNRLIQVGDRLPIARAQVDPKLEAVIHLAAMGIKLCDAADAGAQVDRLLIQPDPSGAKGGAKLLEVLGQAQPYLDQMRADLAAAQRDLAAVSPSALPKSESRLLASTGTTIREGLSGLDEFGQMAPLIENLLGASGPKLYLIEQVNPSELRPGGGFFGTYSVLKADHGSLSVLENGDLNTPAAAETTVYDWPRPVKGGPGYVPPPHVLVGFEGGHSWVLEDSNFFPAFETNAQWGAFFAQHSLNYKVDGVIAMDYNTVAAVLGLIGPIQVPGYDIQLDKDNFVSEVLRIDPVQYFHKSVLAAASKPLMEQVAGLQASSWPQLVQVLNTQVVQRHLQIWLADPTDEALITNLGWRADLNAAQAPDFLMDVEANLGGTKANQQLERKFTVNLTRDGDVLHHEVIVDLQNRNPVDAAYGSNYHAYVRLYTVSTATDVSLVTGPGLEYPGLKSQDFTDLDVPTGYLERDGYLEDDLTFGRNGHYQLVFRYDTPFDASPTGTHELYWQKQPGTGADSVTVNWTSGDHTSQASGDLGQDRLILVGPAGASIQPAVNATFHLPGIGI